MVLIDGQLNDKQHVDIALREYHIDSSKDVVSPGKRETERGHVRRKIIVIF